jgi:hypothetical protein
MFCTTCAARLPIPSSHCPACGAAISIAPASAERLAGSGESASGWLRGDFAERSRSIALPFVLALIVGGWFFWEFAQQHQHESNAYGRAEQSLMDGDYHAAITAFGEAGSYRDAQDRRRETQAMLAPFDTAYLDALSAYETSDYETAIALLEPIQTELPGYRDIETLLGDAQDRLIRSLERETDIAISRRDWIAADTLLLRLTSLVPDEPAYVERLRDLRREHEPILFVKGGHLYQIGPDMADELLLFDDFPIAAPAWSPDRRQVAFFTADAGRSTATSLYVLDLSAGRAVLVSDQAAPDPFLAWSPDSQRIAFVANELFDRSMNANRTYVALYDLATGAIDAIYAPAVDDDTSTYLTNASSPTWSRDDRLAFIATRHPVNPPTASTRRFADVIVANVETGATTNLTNGTLPDVASVSWSPLDDCLLVWESSGGLMWYDSYSTAIYLIDLPASRIERLTHPTEITGRPVWSPDGDKYATVTGQSIVRIRWIEDARAITIDLDVRVNGHIAWSIESDRLLLVPRESTKPAVIVTVEPEVATGSYLHLRFDTNWPNLGLQWSPFTLPAPSRQTETNDASL